MSEVYERERQNNSRLDELASKVSALRGVTVDIYDNARDHQIIDNSNEVFANFGTSLKNSIGRVQVMASNKSRVQIFKLSAITTGTVIFLYMAWTWMF